MHRPATSLAAVSPSSLEICLLLSDCCMQLSPMSVALFTKIQTVSPDQSIDAMNQSASKSTCALRCYKMVGGSLLLRGFAVSGGRKWHLALNGFRKAATRDIVT